MDFQEIENKYSKKIIIAIVILAFVFYSFFSISSPVKYWDEAVYANLGYDVSKNFTAYSFENTGYSDFIPCREWGKYCWPNAGFRPPLLPYLISIFYRIGLESLIFYIIPFFGAITLFIVYLIGKKIFNKKVGIIASIISGLIPIYSLFSGKLLNDIFLTFFITLSVLVFWEAYENNKNKHKLFFGILLALSILARYTALWFFPAFAVYILLRNKFFTIIKDKYFWISILLFVLVLSPWMIYGLYYYNHFLGAFLHGFSAASYWGGASSWAFFFLHSWEFFSIIGIIFIAALSTLFYKKEFLDRKIYLLLLLSLSFFALLTIMPHKEDRFILPIVPIISIISSRFLCSLNKKISNIVISIVLLLLALSAIGGFVENYDNQHDLKSECFLESMQFIKSMDNSFFVITEESAPVYFYTKSQTHFYPNPWSLSKIREWGRELDYKNTIIVFSFNNVAETNSVLAKEIKSDLDDNTINIFSCSYGEDYGAIYWL